MSMYNMFFAENSYSDTLLEALGLTRKDVGRFRNCFISDGKIAVYTRNGAGNRQCWHAEDQESGVSGCKHHVVQKETEEITWVDRGEADSYEKKYNFFHGEKQAVWTGKLVIRDYYVCENPDSIDCACPGCIITYRLPKHPHYLYDRDDELDPTYATIYFSVPEEYRKTIESLDGGEIIDTDQLWRDALAAMGGEEE